MCDWCKTDLKADDKYGWYYAIDVDDFPSRLEHTNATNYTGPFQTKHEAYVHYFETRAEEVRQLKSLLRQVESVIPRGKL